jgi:hypothetical protein
MRDDSISIQPRDFSLLAGLFECRVMTAEHVCILYFDGKREYTKKRLQKLKAAGLISERKRLVNKPSILFLTRKGFKLLHSHGRLMEYPPFGANSFEARANVSESTLRHELEIMDVKAAFHAALGKSDVFSLERFSTWPQLYQFETPRPGHGADILVKPDSFIRIHEKEAGTKGFFHECFLEVDRSNETQDRLVGKAGCYMDYYKSGGFAVRNGGSRSQVKDFPFRVLMVLKSPERRNNTAARLAHNNPPILRQVWLTTLAEVTADPLGPIWILPADYRAVTAGTPFYKERPSRAFEYRRQPEREAFVEEKIKKWRLLETPTVPSSPATADAPTENSGNC